MISIYNFYIFVSRKKPTGPHSALFSLIFNNKLFKVARCTKIIKTEGQDPRYMINVKQFAKFVVDLATSVAPTDIEEGMRVGVDRNKYQAFVYFYYIIFICFRFIFLFLQRLILQ